MIQTSPTPADLWSNPVATADLLQLWTDAQAAAGGGARSGLIWDRNTISVQVISHFKRSRISCTLPTKVIPVIMKTAQVIIIISEFAYILKRNTIIIIIIVILFSLKVSRRTVNIIAERNNVDRTHMTESDSHDWVGLTWLSRTHMIWVYPRRFRVLSNYIRDITDLLLSSINVNVRQTYTDGYELLGFLNN